MERERSELEFERKRRKDKKKKNNLCTLKNMALPSFVSSVMEGFVDLIPENPGHVLKVSKKKQNLPFLIQDASYFCVTWLLNYRMRIIACGFFLAGNF